MIRSMRSIHFGDFYRDKCRELLINRRNKKRLMNKNFSIISSTCLGGVISHDLGCRFNSPFINLWMEPDDYLALLENLDFYINQELKFSIEHERSYPVGLLGELKIYFFHYKTEKEAKAKWDERKKRINFDNLFVCFTEKDGCTFDHLQRFDALPYKNKIVFTKQKYSSIQSSFCIECPLIDEQLGNLMSFRNKCVPIRYIDAFDYVEWLNTGKISKRSVYSVNFLQN